MAADGRLVCSSDDDHDHSQKPSLVRLNLRPVNWNIFVLMATSWCGRTIWIPLRILWLMF